MSDAGSGSNHRRRQKRCAGGGSTGTRSMRSASSPPGSVLHLPVRVHGSSSGSVAPSEPPPKTFPLVFQDGAGITEARSLASLSPAPHSGLNRWETCGLGMGRPAGGRLRLGGLGGTPLPLGQEARRTAARPRPSLPRTRVRSRRTGYRTSSGKERALDMGKHWLSAQYWRWKRARASTGATRTGGLSLPWRSVPLGFSSQAGSLQARTNRSSRRSAW